MKKVLLVACVLMGVQASSFSMPKPKAVRPDNGAAVSTRATTMTRIMAQTVHLDEGQYLKVKQLNLKMLTEVDDIKARYSADPELLDQHLADLQMRYETQLSSLLRPKQLATYQEARNNMTALSITR